MAVGQLDADQFLFAAIDGRNIEHAVGLSLEQTAHLMSAMGCHTAMNLDGGSSKRMVVQNRAVDLASTEVQTSTAASEKVRPVYSAILLHE
jgi:exopolysaccharide biosynthesis protein